MSESKETENNLNEQTTKNLEAPAAPQIKTENPQPSEDMKTAREGSTRLSLRGSFSNGSRKTRSRLSIRRKLKDDPANEMKATMLTFQAVRNKPEQARVQLLLCNISDRDIFVKLRCSAASNVTALPAGSGHISPKSQMRILLTWKHPGGTQKWADLRMPKLLLTTYFMQQGEKSTDEAPTNTRLMAKVSTSKKCNADEPPIEQLLLDAVGKDLGVTPAPSTSPNTAVPQSMTPVDPTLGDKTVRKSEADGEDEVDNLRWIIIALVMVIVLLLLQK